MREQWGETRETHWVSWSLQQFFGVIPLQKPQQLLVRDWLIAALCCHPPKPHVWQGRGKVAAGFVSREDELGNGSAALPAATAQLHPNQPTPKQEPRIATLAQPWIQANVPCLQLSFLAGAQCRTGSSLSELEHRQAALKTTFPVSLGKLLQAQSELTVCLISHLWAESVL